jgi:hypothetical protein
MQVIRIIKITGILSLLVVSFSGCYYDNKQELYPLASGTCDTAAISYSKSIVPIMNLYCSVSGCHNTASAAAGIKTDTYLDLKAAVNGGRFVGAIEGTSGFSPMPKGGAKMSTCNLNKINAWINAKMPNN